MPTGLYSAAVLGIRHAGHSASPISATPPRIWVSDHNGLTGHWLSAVGILAPLPLAPEIDSSILVGFPSPGASSGTTAIPFPSICAPSRTGTEQARYFDLAPPGAGGVRLA